MKMRRWKTRTFLIFQADVGSKGWFWACFGSREDVETPPKAREWRHVYVLWQEPGPEARPRDSFNDFILFLFVSIRFYLFLSISIHRTVALRKGD